MTEHRPSYHAFGNIAETYPASKGINSATPVTPSPLEELILSCVPYVEHMARKYSWNAYRVEFDEMYSVGITAVCEKARRAYKTAENPFAYLVSTAHYATLEALRRIRKHEAISLDAPRSDDNALHLGDLLVSRSSVLVPDTSSQKRAQALHRAIQRLASPRQREVLQRLYGFVGLGHGTLSGTHKEVARELGISRGAVSFHATRGRESLRADAELCEVVGVEPTSQGMKPREVPVSPEVIYARELAAWNAGYTSYGSMAKTLGYPKWKAQWRMTKMREAGIIPECKVPTSSYGVV